MKHRDILNGEKEAYEPERSLMARP